MISRFTKPVLALGLALFAGSLSSCSKFSKGNNTTAIKAAPPAAVQWHSVSQSPPKYFPKGLSADTPTSAYHGFWVSDTANESQWFVPKNGVKGFSAARLQKDAMARLKPATKAKLPKFKAPNFKAPKVKLPTVTMPKLKLPKLKMPQMTLPKFKSKKATQPKLKTSQFKFPTIKAPKIPAIGSKIKAANSKVLSGTKHLAGKALFWRKQTS